MAEAERTSGFLRPIKPWTKADIRRHLRWAMQAKTAGQALYILGRIAKGRAHDRTGKTERRYQEVMAERNAAHALKQKAKTAEAQRGRS